MHPAHPCADTCAPNRSPQLVRLLILGVFALGLLGLGATSGAAATPVVRVTAAAAESPLAPGIKAAPTVLPHASRSRALAPRRHAVAPRPAWVRPSPAPIVSPFGMRWGRLHKGIDFGASYGDPIRAVGDGVVVGAGYLADEGGYGQIVIIRHAGGFYSAYAHQSRIAVRAGMHVQAGEIIGYVGSTGHSTGPHLHFEIRMSLHGGQVDPAMWLLDHGVRV